VGLQVIKGDDIDGEFGAPNRGAAVEAAVDMLWSAPGAHIYRCQRGMTMVTPFGKTAAAIIAATMTVMTIVAVMRVVGMTGAMIDGAITDALTGLYV
jgi:hypothetical protein